MTVNITSTTDDLKEVESQVKADATKREQEVTIMSGEELADSPDDKTTVPPTEAEPPAEAVEAKADEAAPEAPPADDEATPEQGEEPEPSLGKVQDRIDRALRDKHTALARAQELEAELEKVRAQNLAAQKAAEATPPVEEAAPATPAEDTATVTTPPPDEPVVENFASYEEWVKAHGKWEVQQAVADIRKELTAKVEEQLSQRDLEAEKEAAKHVEAEAMKLYQERYNGSRSRHEDFDKVMEASKDNPISSPMRQVFVGSELGTEMMYHLASNPEQAEAMMQLSEAAQYMALGKLEAQLVAQGVTPPDAVGSDTRSRAALPKPSLTSAPPPIETVESAPIAAQLADDAPDLPFSEYVKRREDHEKRVGRR